MSFNIFKPKLHCNYTEKEILCDLIEKYIEIANINDSTLDDYVSVISLIKMLQLQYKEYSNDFQKYIYKFEKKGILSEYQKYFKNVPKQIFEKNDWQPNIKLADDMLYGFFNGCTSRFMHFLIIFGLCGKPVTKKQKCIMAHLFETNSVAFSKQTIYYLNLYFKSGVISTNNPFVKKSTLIKLEKKRFYKLLAEAYMREKNYTTAIEFFEYTIQIVKSIPNKNIKKDETIKELNLKIKYAKFKIKYPYVRKDLLNIFNIDIKTFNLITKDIKNNEEYKLNQGYSEKVLEYIKNKL